MDVQTRCDISGTVEDRGKLLLSANMKSHMPRRLAQQRMTLSDLEWPFYASRAISAVAQPYYLHFRCPLRRSKVDIIYDYYNFTPHLAACRTSVLSISRVVRLAKYHLLVYRVVTRT